MQDKINASIAKNQISSDIIDVINSIIFDDPALKPATNPDIAGQGSSGYIASATVENCKNEMELISRIVPSNSTMPVLKSVRVCIAQGRILFETCNIESRVAVTLPANITGNCDIVVPWGKHFRAKSLEINVLQDEIVFVNGTKLQYQDSEEFPQPAGIPERKSDFSITISDLNSIRNATDFSANDELKPALNGFYFDKNRFAATDGHRLIIRQLQNQIGCSVIMPKYLASYYPVMKKLFQFDPVPVWIDTENSWFWLKISPNIEFWARLINENYPNVDSVIPNLKETKYSCEISGDDLNCIFETIKPAFLNAKGPVNWLRFCHHKILTYCTYQGEPNQQVFQNPSAIRPPFEIQFNYYYLRAIAKRYSPGDQIRIYLNGPDRAALLIRTDENLNDEIVLLMPIRIND
jgi:DNA polymerase III sliding clamp (beta) subunit (PCNA family)